MARTNNLTDFLTDVADAIKNKKGDDTPILASEFDTEITNLPSGGSSSVVLDGTMKFQGSTFSTLPEWLANANGWDNYTTMDYMFYDCKSLTTIPLIDMSKVTNMNHMFYDCKSLTTIPLIDTSNVTNMNQMFYDCKSLTTIPLIDTSKVTSMQSMFLNCKSLTTIPLIDTSKVTTMESLVYGCKFLTNESLDNILQMCINASLYTKEKVLTSMGLNSNYYPATTIQSLPHYQDFINAGWTIGY